MIELEPLVQTARRQFEEASTVNELENAKAQFLGKSGRVTALMKGLATLSVEEKKAQGAVINQAKQAIEAALQARHRGGASGAPRWLGARRTRDPVEGRGIGRDAARPYPGCGWLAPCEPDA